MLDKTLTALPFNPVVFQHALGDHESAQLGAYASRPIVRQLRVIRRQAGTRSECVHRALRIEFALVQRRRTAVNQSLAGGG